jgi:ABC-type transporter MlaC component
LSTPDKEELVKRAKFLRNAAPQQFNDFYTAFVNYADRTYKDLVQAETGNFLQMQGHAQQCKAIVQILEGARNG